MEWIGMLVFGALIFGVCFLVDKGFSKVFRGKTQHKTGKRVRLNRRYAIAGIMLTFLSISFLVSGAYGEALLLAASLTLLLLGAGLLVYYLSFGIYYDDDSFLVSGFAKRNRIYHYDAIRFQQRYRITGGNLLLELHMADGTSVQIYTQMDGSTAFLEHAHHCWCVQKQRNFCHDPENFVYFPSEEEI